MYQLKCIPNSSIASSDGPQKSQLGLGNVLQNAGFRKDVDATAFLFLVHRIDRWSELLNCAVGIYSYGWRAGWVIIYTFMLSCVEERSGSITISTAFLNVLLQNWDCLNND
jgi:hypothetical protein